MIHTLKHLVLTRLLAATMLLTLAAFYPHQSCAVTASGQLVPEELNVPTDQTISMEAQGIGVQKYKCGEKRTGQSKYEWVFEGPEATLYDKAGKQIGKHYEGPTWESDDGSKVVGQVVHAYDSPDVNAIAWLLLKAKSTSGSGMFSRVTSIQRLDTFGGKAPAEGCTEEQAGKEIRVPYKAIYYFYVSRP